jgi:hypothetical protein
MDYERRYVNFFQNIEVKFAEEMPTHYTCTCIYLYVPYRMGQAWAQFMEALSYKPEGRGFDYRLGIYDFR